MIEAQQQVIGDHDLMARRPVVLPTDKACVLMRRRLGQLISKEHKQKEPAGSAP
jgi:hypothetical protein